MKSMRQVIRGATIALALMVGAAQAADTVRPEVGKPLQEAQSLIKARKYKEALAKVNDADAAANKTAYENYLIEYMRLSAAMSGGEMNTAAKAYDALAASGKLGGAEKLKMMESIAGGYYREKNWAKAIEWAQRYQRDGGTSAQMQTLLVQAQFQSGDKAGVAKELMAEIQADEKAGRAPPEDQLKLLMNASASLPEGGGYSFALERLVTYYPKKEYWAELIAGVQRKPGFSDRFSLDIYRLMLATGGMTKANDYMETTQLALQAGLAAEAKAAIDKGFAAGVLGTGPEADRQKRLRDLAVRKAEEAKAEMPAKEAEAMAEKDGTALVAVGFNLVTSGQAAKGVTLIEKGIAKGGLKRPEDAKLRLGQAMVLAGSPKAAGVLRGVTGADGTADLARMWIILARRKG